MMSNIKKPTQPNKPIKPSAPIRPKEFGCYSQPPIRIDSTFYMDYNVEKDYYDGYELKASLSLDSFNSMQEHINKFKLEHPNASDVTIDMVYMNIQFSEDGPNLLYVKEMKSYEKNLKSYNQKMIVYNKTNEKYLVDMKQYNELKLAYDLDQARLNLKQLEEKSRLSID